jgi:hypothetical protein
MGKQEQSRKKPKPQPVPEPEEEDEGEYEEEEEEEEEEDEEDIKEYVVKDKRGNKPDHAKLEKRPTKHDNDIIDDLEGKPEDEEEEEEEKRRLTNEEKAVKRLSRGSSQRRSGSKHQTTVSDFLVPKKRLKFREKLIKWYSTKWFSLFMLVITGWTMLSDDFRVLGPKGIDPLFYTIILLCSIIFTTDIVLSCIFKKEYLFTSYFF